MNFRQNSRPNVAARTALAKCFFGLSAVDLSPAGFLRTPAGAIDVIFNTLSADKALSQEIRISRSGGSNTRNHKTAKWLPNNRGQYSGYSNPHGKPHFSLRLLRAESMDQLKTCFGSGREPGIFINDIETTSPVLAKGVQAALPLWLSSHRHCIPFDPSSGHEALAIIRSALHAACSSTAANNIYLSMHDDQDMELPPLSRVEAQSAFKGMYRVTTGPAMTGAADIRLCGAGKALKCVMLAARLLQNDWGMTAEVWSCPSFTRLAREADEAEQWNMLHPLSQPKKSHLSDCLGNNTAPAVAVTGYPQAISNQIGAFVNTRFTALGADSFNAAGSMPAANWIAVTALKALADDESIPRRWVGDAVERYRKVS